MHSSRIRTVRNCTRLLGEGRGGGEEILLTEKSDLLSKNIFCQQPEVTVSFHFKVSVIQTDKIKF